MVQIITQIFMYVLWLSLLNIKIYFADLKYENMKKKNPKNSGRGKILFHGTAFYLELQRRCFPLLPIFMLPIFKLFIS